MDCSQSRDLLHSYVDRELDAEEVARIDKHLEFCDACRKAFERQSSLSAAIRDNATYYRAPEDLLSRVRAKVGDGAVPRNRSQSLRRRWGLPQWPRWMQVGVAIVASVLMTTAATLQLNNVNADEAVAAQIINGHARSVLTSHPMDVASSDQHTVKPWLSSKLDFSPPVVDLTTSGFPLRGGRLDYVENRAVAVLIYAHRQHVIDLYVWPGARSRDIVNRSRILSKNGFNIVHWNDSDMTYWAISDVNVTDLQAFAHNYTSAR